MAYVSDSNLTQFWELAKDYINAENSRYASWQKTEKAGAVTCWPVGGTPLEPTVDFMFTETSPVSGTKGPDNPSAITGVSSIGLTVCQEEGVDEHSYTISLGGTYYGGSIDLATGLMTVTHYGKVLDESTLSAAAAGYTWDGDEKMSKRLFFKLNGSASGFPAIKTNTSITCSHFSLLQSGYGESDMTFGSFFVNTASAKWIMFYDNDQVVSSESNTVYKNAALFVNWFEAKKNNGDPVYLVYELATPYTVQLTPAEILSLTQTDKYTPRLNTVYTDASAVQVGYAKSPIRSEYELTQAIIATEGGE